MATAYDNDARLIALMERLDHGQAYDVITARTMAYGYAVGRLDEGGGSPSVSAYGFAVAYALSLAEMRARVTVDKPTLPDAWARWLSTGAVDDYRRRLGEGETRPATVAQ